MVLLILILSGIYILRASHRGLGHTINTSSHVKETNTSSKHITSQRDVKGIRTFYICHQKIFLHHENEFINLLPNWICSYYNYETVSWKISELF